MKSMVVGIFGICAGTAFGDLYASAGSNGTIRYYTMSTVDASTVLLSEGNSPNGVYEMCLASDGELYAEAIFSVDRVDPVQGTTEYLTGIDGPCWSTGAIAAGDGVLYVGVGGPQCWTPFLVWNITSQEFTGWFEMAECFNPMVAAMRDDGLIIAVFYADPMVYALDPTNGGYAAIGKLPEGTQLESSAQDRVTGVTYMLGQLPEDPWSLYQFDLYTLELTWVGEVEPSDMFTIAAMPPCDADFNADGELGILDFVALQLAWKAGDDEADVNGDGVLDVLDFVAFHALFQEGCT